MDKLINRDIYSFTDMNNRGGPRTYEIGDIENRHSESSVQIEGIIVQLFGAVAAFTVFYSDDMCRLVITNNFSAVSLLEKYDRTR